MADYDPDLFQTERPTDTPIVRVRPRRAGPRSETDSNNSDTSISPVMDQVLDHIAGPESGKRYDVIYGGQRVPIGADKEHPRIAVPITSGPNKGKTSSAFGAFQFIGSTWDEVAAKTGRHDTSPESQRINAAYLAKETYKKETGRDLEKDWASGDPSLKAGIDRALGTQWESLAAGPRVGKLGRPDSDYSGPGFGFSDYALNEHKSRPDTDIHWMSPSDYLDLAMPLEGKPFESPSGKSLLQSFRRGDHIESVPSLDVNVNGNTAKVADQDGRHRALLAQQEGVPMIPVAVKRTGEGEPTEIEGMSGNKRPLEMPKRQPSPQEPEQQKEPISLSRVAGELFGIPKAEAAETGGGVPDWARETQAAPQQQDVPDWAQEGQGDQTATKPAQPPDPRAVAPGGMVGALGVGALKGLGETASGAEELLGKSLGLLPGAIGRAGDTIAAHAQANNQSLQDSTAETAKAHPWMTGIGDILGSSVVPSALGGRSPSLSGFLGGLMSPSGGGDNFWTTKAEQAGVGLGLGMATGPAANALSKLGGVTKPAVAMLAKEGVQMTPGQIAGGTLKAQEDKLTSLPFIGEQIKEATRRSIQTFNKAAINRGLDDIGVKLPDSIPSGRQAIAWAEDQFRDAYDTVIPSMIVELDNPMKRDLLKVMQDANAMRIPDKYQQELMFAIKNKIVDPIQQAPGQQLNGRSAQMMGSDLDQLINKWRNATGDGAPYYSAMAKLLRNADTALDNALERLNPIQQVAKAKIDKGYAKFKVVQKAANYATGNADGTFTPFQLLRASKFSDGSKDDRLFARGGAMLQDLASAAQKVLPSHYPDSGTAGRGALGALITGHLMGWGGLAAALTAGAAYTPPASKALSAAAARLAQQPGMVRNALANIGRAVSNASPILAGGLAQNMGQQFQGQPNKSTFYQPPP